MRYKGFKVILVSSAVVLIIIVLIVLAERQFRGGNTNVGGEPTQTDISVTQETKPPMRDPFLDGDGITVNYLTVNEYSRPGDRLGSVNAIVIHYVGNPGTTAAQNRSYFEGLKDGHGTSASSHYIVGLDGEIIQCVPLDEISYASNERNRDTIAIECCHPDATGKFNAATYASLVKLTAALCNTYGLSPDTDIIRHYDITGKKCPLYFVDNEDEWYGFKLSVRMAMQQQGVSGNDFR